MVEQREISLEGLSVCIGIPAGRDFHPFTVRSLMETQMMCYQHGVQLDLVFVASSSVIQWARDEVIHQFLTTSKANRLFWIDSDMIWDAKDFMRMLALTTFRKVICGLYPAKIEPPTFYLKYDEEGGKELDEFGLWEINGAGLGFTIMHREIIEKLHDNAPKIYDDVSQREIAQIFKVGHASGKRLGEDICFFKDVKELGYKIYADTLVNLTHLGKKEYKSSTMEAIKPLIKIG